MLVEWNSNYMINYEEKIKFGVMLRLLVLCAKYN